MRENKNLERRYLFLYSAMTLFMLAAIVVNHHNMSYAVPVVILLLLNWGLFVTEKWTPKGRNLVLVLATLCNYVIYGFFAQNLMSAMLPYMLMVAMIGMMDEVSYLYDATGCFFVVVCYQIFYGNGVKEQGVMAVFQVILVIMCAVFLQVILAWQIKNSKDKEEELKDTIQALRESENSKDDFMANVSHEIRTPLNTICGMSDLLIAEGLSEQAKEQAFNIRVAGQKMQDLISDILDFSQLQDDNIPIVKSEYSYSSVLNDVLNIAIAQNEEKKLELIVDCDAKLPAELVGDVDKIKRILNNLISNAIKFTNSGYVYIGTTFREEKYGINLNITVKDTGIGMTPKTVESISGKITQVDTSKKRKQEGIGLGLALTAKFVRLMNGFMHVESAENIGTTVQIMIPQAVKNPNPMISVRGAEDLRIALYVDAEKYAKDDMLEVYLKTYQNMSNGLDVKLIRTQSIAELKHGIDMGWYTHIFMSVQEYRNHKEYFESVAKEQPIILVMEYEDQDVDSRNFYFVYKPYSVFNIAAILNGEKNKERYEGQFKDMYRFIIPEARILAVDDNEMNLQVVEGIARPYQAHFYRARSGKEALELVEQVKFDMIFMDHMMPEMDGVECFHAIRAKSGTYCEKVPIVALTANAVSGAREMFLSEGFTDYVAKPIDLTQFERVLVQNIPPSKIILLEKDSIEEKQSEIVNNSTQSKESEFKKEAATEEIKKEEFVLEPEVGLVYAGKSKEVYKQILEIFLEGSGELKEALIQAFVEENWEEYRRNAHTLKSNSLQVGATLLSGLCKLLEQACKDGDYDYIRDNHQQMLAQYEGVYPVVKSYWEEM